MKKLILLFLITILASCANHTQKKYSDFDYSFARSGGYAPIYENLLIKGNKAHYSFEGNGKNIKKDFTLSNDDLKNIENTLTQNKFTTIQEDYKKLYDHISVEINVKKGSNAGSKNDASFIMEKNKDQWEEIVHVFQKVIDTNVPLES